MSKPIHDEPHTLYKERGRAFNYTVMKEDFYPNKTLWFRKPKIFPLSNVPYIIKILNYDIFL